MEPGRVATRWGWVGDYELVSRIAVGGMGEVFLARQHGAAGFRRLVALKRLLPELAGESELVELFIDEARIAAQLAHPGIVQIHELGRADDGAFFISMEYVPGQNLAKILRRLRERGERAPLDAALAIGGELCAALDYAHDARDADGRALELVHRDVSPHNLLVGYGGAVKLMDFGIAKATSALHRTATGVIRGKYAYMSPEHVAGAAVDHRADLYSAGVVLWELLCGERLFGGSTEIEELREVARAEIRAVREVRPELGDDIDAVVMKALAADPADRWPTAAELGQALREIARVRDLELDRSAVGALMERLFAGEREATDEMVEAATGTASIGAGVGVGKGVGVGGREGAGVGAGAGARRAGRIAAVSAAVAIAGLGAAMVFWPGALDIDPVTAVAPAPLDAALPDAPPPTADAAPVIDAAPAAPIDAAPRAPARRPPRRRPDASPPIPTPRDAAPERPIAPGTLVVDSTPWGNARVGGVARGQTPAIMSLPPGRYPVIVTPSDGTAALRATAIIESGKRTKCIARSRRLGCSPPR
jgi:tRNA A-37 threonylcarbamoyl transferase component Bud32